MRKIIFLDVDGTLVDYENRLPDSAVTAIRKARAKDTASTSARAAARQRSTRRCGT